MAEWFSIEVFDGDGSCVGMADSHGDSIVAAAPWRGPGTSKSPEYGDPDLTWGVVLELELPDEFAWERLRDLPAIRAVARSSCVWIGPRGAEMELA